MRLLLAYDPNSGSSFVCGPCSTQYWDSLDTPEKRSAHVDGPEALPYVAVLPTPRPGEPRNGLCIWCGHQVWLGIDGEDFERAEHEPYDFADEAGDPWARSSERAASYAGTNRPEH